MTGGVAACLHGDENGVISSISRTSSARRRRLPDMDDVYEATRLMHVSQGPFEHGDLRYISPKHRGGTADHVM